MLSVSGVNFGNKAILEREGKYSQNAQQAAKTPDMPEDSFDKPKKKHTGLKAFLWTAGILLAAAGGLGWAAKTGKLQKVDLPEGVLDHTKNFFGTIGEKVAKGFDDAVNWVKGFRKQPEELVDDIV